MSHIPKRVTRIRQIIQRAEQILAAQRTRVEQSRSEGNREGTKRALTLLKLMEGASEQVRLARALLQAGPLRQRLGAGVEIRPARPQLASSLSCPHCGLETRYRSADDGSITLEYDYTEWSERCRRRHLEHAA